MMTLRLLYILFLSANCCSVYAQVEPPRLIPTAILPFQLRTTQASNPLLRQDNLAVNRDESRTFPAEAGRPEANRKELADKDVASIVVDLLTVRLLASEHVMLVERQEIERIFDELKLSKAGLVKNDEATQVGRLTGAKLLITGSVLKIDGDLYLVAKIIGTETSRLAGASVKGPANSDLGELVDKLATELDSALEKKAEALLPKSESEDDWIASVKKKMGNKKLPKVTVGIQQQGGSAPKLELAAKVEMERILQEVGFEVIAADDPKAVRADFAIVGESKSEFAFRRGDWIAVRCRIDLQIRSQSTGKAIAADSETTMVYDLVENLAAKAGLKEAILKIAKRVVPKLVE